MKKENEIAVFGAGCFWCTEAIYKRLEGVISVEPGYAGGSVENPTYEIVCSGKSGHAEVAKIIFNSEVIAYEELLDVFFSVHDPTSLNRQGDDIGEQYRSVIFYSDSEQKEKALKKIRELEEKKIFPKPIVTSVEPLKNYYPAEDYHKQYYESHKNQPYCAFVISPKIEKFEKQFADKIKEIK